MMLFIKGVADSASQSQPLSRRTSISGQPLPSVKIITTDSVWQGYLEGLVFYAVSFGASLLTIDPANERGVELFEALVHRTFTAVDDLDAGLALGFAAAG